MSSEPPDPTTLHPVAGQSEWSSSSHWSAIQRRDRRVHLLRRPRRRARLDRDAVLYAYGPERLVIGRFCAIASRVRFLMPGAHHADRGPSTFPFGIFGEAWAQTMDLVMSAPSRGDTVVGHDVWIGYAAMVMPGVTIGHGAVVAAGSVVASDVPAYAIAAGNPARVVRRRYEDDDVERLLRAAWWDWPIGLVTEHARSIMAGTPAELERLAAENGLLG